ncbi:MAG: hypothetical protein ACRDS9_22560 [Pseudonocardiaceae bacterium]
MSHQARLEPCRQVDLVRPARASSDHRHRHHRRTRHRSSPETHPAHPAPTRLTKQQIRDLITAVGDLRTAIRRADAAHAKTVVYQRLRIRLVYQPATRQRPTDRGMSPVAADNRVGQVGILPGHVPKLRQLTAF